MRLTESHHRGAGRTASSRRDSGMAASALAAGALSVVLLAMSASQADRRVGSRA